MINNLLSAIVETGLLQFGLFEGVPFKLSLDMLPSYPDVLRLLRDEAIQELEQVEYDHLVCTHDAFALGMALSLELDKPLVWCREKVKSAASDLVGAYDFGHPAVLITSIWDDPQPINHLIQVAGRVGLEIETVVAIVDFERADIDDYTVCSLLKLWDSVNQLVTWGQLPAGQAQAVEKWLTG